MKNILTFIFSFFFLCSTAVCQTTSIYADNIIIVFDASGSMNARYGDNTRLHAAKAALKQVLLTLKDDSNVGLFVFGDVNNENPVPIGPKNIELLFSSIDSISAGGGTPLGEFIKRATNQILKQREKNYGYGRYKIIVLTDGEASDSTLMDSATKELLKRRLSLDVIGVGMDKQHNLARVSSYKAANDPLALKQALNEIVAEVPLSTDADENDFKIVSALSDQQAMSIISGLSSNENQPLFEQPTASNVNANNTSVISTSTTDTSTNVIIIIIAIIIMIIILGALFR
jgi:uncharacterized protein YegL